MFKIHPYTETNDSDLLGAAGYRNIPTKVVFFLQEIKKQPDYFEMCLPIIGLGKQPCNATVVSSHQALAYLPFLLSTICWHKLYSVEIGNNWVKEVDIFVGTIDIAITLIKNLLVSGLSGHIFL